jgi:hypothetical protein
MPFGKIDQLPAALRHEVCERLEDGQTGAEILPWLNGLPAVKKHLATKFKGDPITDQNLSNWRTGGFQTWRARREKTQRTRELADYARTLGADSAAVFAGGAAIAGGMLMEALEGLDVQRQIELLEEKPENLPGFINALARLQDSEGKNRERALKASRHELDVRALELAIEKHEISTAEKLLKKATSKEVQDIIGSSEPKAVKIKQLRLALYGPATVKPAPVIQE